MICGPAVRFDPVGVNGSDTEAVEKATMVPWAVTTWLCGEGRPRQDVIFRQKHSRRKDQEHQMSSPIRMVMKPLFGNVSVVPSA